jgi:hypothetical protein
MFISLKSLRDNVTDVDDSELNDREVSFVFNCFTIEKFFQIIEINKTLGNNASMV